MSVRGIEVGKGLVAVVDACDYEWLTDWHWYTTGGVGPDKGGPYAHGYHPATKRKAFMHRLIAQTPEAAKTDHINGDTLNNRRCNLRVVTHAENMRNRKRQLNNTSGYRGVRLHTVEGKYRSWVARINVDGKEIWLGTHATAEEAAAAYDKAAVTYYGTFARVNFAGTNHGRKEG